MFGHSQNWRQKVVEFWAQKHAQLLRIFLGFAPWHFLTMFSMTMMTRFISAADIDMISFVFEYIASENREAKEYMTVVTARRYTITPITATRTTRS